VEGLKASLLAIGTLGRWKDIAGRQRPQVRQMRDFQISRWRRLRQLLFACADDVPNSFYLKQDIVKATRVDRQGYGNFGFRYAADAFTVKEGNKCR
jgi:hypothetical protein